MDRRTFLGTLAGGLLAAPLAAAAQQAGKIARIGYLPTGGVSEQAETPAEGEERLSGSTTSARTEEES
jgi:hypothetical protein